MKRRNKKGVRLWLAVFFTVSFFLSSQNYYGGNFALADDSISELESKIKKEEAEKQKLEEELYRVQSSVNYNQSLINKTEALIEAAEKEIKEKKEDMENLGGRIKLQKEILKNLLRESYYSENDPAIFLFLQEKDFSKVVAGNDHRGTVNQKILDVIEDIRQAKVSIEEDKKNVEEQKSNQEKMVALKESQQRDLLEAKYDVQADIQDKAKTISQLQNKLNELRITYSAALGKDVSVDDIIEAAKFASRATGIRKSFLLGVLMLESKGGKYVGGCDYKSSRMKSNQLEALKDIADDLDYNYKKLKVSCPSSSYAGTGGAMGAGQFMPTTWQGYKSSIASYTGHNPPDPWELVDGVTASAIKLSRDGANKKTRFAEAKSYCVYLAGGNWGYYCFGTDRYKKSYEDYNCYGPSIRNYGEKVLCLADNYEKYY